MSQSIISSELFLPHNRICSGFTTRELGSDYQKIASLLEVDLKNINTLKQVHFNKVVKLTEPIGLEGVEADALVTDLKNVIIGVRVADCLPLLVYDPVCGVVAAIHAGWRGLVSGVIENSLHAMTEYGCALKNCHVSLGPCICEKCFEVGQEVVTEFKNKFTDVSQIIFAGQKDKSFIHLKQAAQIILKAKKIPEKQIEINHWCTRCENNVWPSFRAGDATLRTLAYIALKN
ncbi:MAG: hypothetical protein ACD_73C00773G0004 [uncultured bacterium]|nr:MAG: hypothetical protein ACD_73C00773G0004 [uncultured bacterium]